MQIRDRKKIHHSLVLKAVDWWKPLVIWTLQTAVNFRWSFYQCTWIHRRLRCTAQHSTVCANTNSFIMWLRSRNYIIRKLFSYVRCEFPVCSIESKHKVNRWHIIISSIEFEWIQSFSVNSDILFVAWHKDLT